eukprot:TRINITY_DN72510_c0_g1_i1.p1 TRINITY_DN72510_c0_g1~~TRINITY_DN72510_c0_g1_i1.p1  ORF type:complete len:180 (-),score=41.52 TRINITY_DN72510_c0_g1_i1:95-634(-)
MALAALWTAHGREKQVPLYSMLRWPRASQSRLVCVVTRSRAEMHFQSLGKFALKAALLSTLAWPMARQRERIRSAQQRRLLVLRRSADVKEGSEPEPPFPTYEEWVEEQKKTLEPEVNDGKVLSALTSAEAVEVASLGWLEEDLTFVLRCLDCQQEFTSQADADEHAKATGHTNFEEIT